jgi:site-specific DNA recombinase
MRAAIYIRVSSDEQVENWSLGAQREQCQALADARGWQIFRIYEEPGLSAKTDQRPAFQKMLYHAEARLFDVIIIHKLDRFSRSLVDVVKHVTRLKAVHVGLVSVSEGWLDTTTQGEFLLYLTALLAQWDNQNRAKETAKGKEARAKAGYWNGTLSFGYVTPKSLRNELAQQLQHGELTSETHRDKLNDTEHYIANWPGCTPGDAIPHSINATGILLAYNTYAQGNTSDNGVALRLNQEGYRTTGNWGARLFEMDTVRPMLQNRFYLGETSYKGKIYPGRHPALIPEELFEQCQQIRARRRNRTVRGRSVRRVYPLTRLALCARCGKPMRGQPERKNRRYYRDPRRTSNSCDQPMIPAEKAEQTIINLLAQIKLPDDWRERVIALSFPEKDRQTTENKQRRLKTQLDRAKTLFLLGEMSEEEYFRMREELRDQLAALRPSPEPDLEVAASLLEDIGAVLQQATPKELDKLFHTLLNTVYLEHSYPGFVLAIEPKPALFYLLQASSVIKEGKLCCEGNSGGDDDANDAKFDCSDNMRGIISTDDAGNVFYLAVPSSMPVAPDLDIIDIGSNRFGVFVLHSFMFPLTTSNNNRGCSNCHLNTINC